MVSDDDSDVDITLEEVSKIFRCKDCKRCFLSHSKFAEHFPTHHPDVLVALKNESTEDQTRKELSSSEKRNSASEPENGTVGAGKAATMSNNETNYSAEEIPESRRLAKRSKPFSKLKEAAITKISDPSTNNEGQPDEERRMGQLEKGTPENVGVFRKEIETITISDTEDNDINSHSITASFIPTRIKQEIGEDIRQQDENHYSTCQDVNSGADIPSANRNEKDLDSKETETSKPARKRRKTWKLCETPGPVIAAKPAPERVKRRPSLAFSCKWCKEKFEKLEGLKTHAMNVHIKYKTPE